MSKLADFQKKAEDFHKAAHELAEHEKSRCETIEKEKNAFIEGHEVLKALSDITAIIKTLFR